MDEFEVAVASAVGADIAKRRVKQELRQQDLAGVIGRSRTAVVNIEAGQQGISLAMFLRIADALECEPAELLPDQSVLQGLISLGIQDDDLSLSHGRDVSEWVRAVVAKGRNG